jgi:hypothetical protein
MAAAEQPKRLSIAVRESPSPTNTLRALATSKGAAPFGRPAFLRPAL